VGTIRPVASGLTRANKLFPFNGWNLLYLLGALVVFCSLFVRLQIALESGQNQNDISYSTSAAYVQVNLALNRTYVSEGPKHRKALFLCTGPVNSASHQVYAGEYFSSGILYASNIVRHRNIQQALMLLDRPPPSTASFFL
jgi:hypothetical protein